MPTQKLIAEHLDMNQSEVSRHMAELALDWKTVSLEEIRVAYIRKLRAVAAGHKSHDGLDLTRERVLTEQVERELKQYELAERKGALVSVAQLEPELKQMFGAFKTELLARDDKLKAELDALYGIDVDASLLEEHTRAALIQLARYDPERDGHGAPAGGDDGTGAEDDHDGMGAEAPPHVGEVDGQAGGLQP
jgi:DNA-binding transcriptional ArsR family regulator